MSRLARRIGFACLAVLLLGSVLRADDEPAPTAARAPLGPSWRELGVSAYERGDHDEAVYQWRRWLEADPRDETTWYDLACSYALLGRTELAIAAYERAVDAGWHDAAHAKEDPDLASLQSDARFQTALRRTTESAGAEGPKEAVRHWVRIVTLGTYLALLPPDYEKSGRAYPLVVILHGAGSSETGHGTLADRLGREGVIWVVPRAPYPTFQTARATGRPGWISRPEDADPDAIRPFDPTAMYVDTILAAVADARKRYRVEGERFHVLGHSMGAYGANILAALHPDLVATYLAYAGGLPEEVGTKERLHAEAQNHVRAWLVHGRSDKTVDPAGSEDAARRLEAAGVETHLTMLDDVDHRVRPPALEAMRRWLDEAVRNPK